MSVLFGKIDVFRENNVIWRLRVKPAYIRKGLSEIVSSGGLGQ